MVFYDRNGRPTAYVDDNVHIFLFSGEAVGYLNGNAVFSYKGKHLGWFDKGWIRDLKGCCVFYSEKVTGGPVTPVKKVCPVKSVKRIIPVKHVEEIKKVRAVDRYDWSPLSGEAFFAQ